MKNDKDIDYAEIMSDVAMILDTSMVIRSNHDDHNLANHLVEFAQALSSCAATAGVLNHGA